MSKKPTLSVKGKPSKAKEAELEVEVKEEAPKTKSKFKAVTVKNLTKVRFVQPTSKINIWGGETKPLNDDSWLESQIKAGYMEIVD